MKKRNNRFSSMYKKGGEKEQWISDKISTLMDEGKSHDQAVAQALSMSQEMFQEGGYRVETDLEGYNLNTTPIVSGDLNNIEQYQKYTGKGYGNQLQDVNKTINTHGWYFSDEDKKKRFLEASTKKGGSQEVKNFQEAYNRELKSRLDKSGLDEQQKTKIYNESAFTGKGVQSIDGKFGAFTSSRPMFEPTQQNLSPQPELLTPVFSETPSIENQTINKPKLYKVRIHAEDMSDNNRDHQQGNLNAYIQDRTEKQGGLTEADLEYVKKALELNNKDIEAKYNNEDSKKNKKAQERYKKLKQSLVIEEFKYGGELPKYQKGVNFDSSYNRSLYSTYTQKYPDSSIQQKSSVNLTPQSSTPGKEISAYPSTTYNPSYITPQNNNNSNFSVGNLDLNNSLFTSNNVSGVTTQTPKPTKEEFDQWNSSYKAKNTTTGATTPATTTTKQDGSSFYQGMFSQPNYNPPADLGFNQGEQYYGLGRDKNYVSAISPESLTAGEDWAKNNPLPQGVVSKESGFETPLMDKYAKENVVETPQLQRQTPPIQFANPYGGVDLNAASALFGQSLQQGDTLMGVASGAKLGLGLARNFMSGYAAGKDRNRVLNDYSSNMRNAMTGAETPNQLYQEGGTASEQDQLLQQVAMMLQQGLPPEQIMQELVAMGMPQDQAIQAIEMVMQQSQAPQEQQMMQEGGVAKQPEVPVEMANAEIEGGEYVQDTEGVKYAEGAKHSEGGIPTQLENGARVLSDYKKVGKDLAKQLSEQVGFEVKASDTFATVLDKFNRKEGFDKKVKHLDEYSDKLEKQEKTVKHDATLALNKQILMEEAQEDTQKLQELVKQQEGLFNMLFEAQEATKVMEEGGNFMQNGGTVNDLMAKYNISAEEASKLIPSFQGDKGSNTYYEQANPYFASNPGRAGRLEDWINSQMYKVEYESGDVEAKKERFKDLADNAGVPYTEEDFKDSKSIDAFAGKLQKFIIENKPELALDYGRKVEPTRAGLQYLVDNGLIKPEDYGIKMVNGKVARGSYDTLTTDADKRLMETIANLPQDKVKDYALKNYNDNLGYFRGIKTRDQQLTEEEYNKFTSENNPVGGGYYETKVPGVYVKPNKIGEVAPQTTEEALIPTTETPMEIPTTPVVDVAQDKEKNRLNFLNLPDQTPMLPWAMQAPAMLRQTIYAPRWNEISPEQQLTDIQRGRVATAEQMSFLPDSQQASSLFALDANAMAAQNKVRSETERYNQMARERTEAAEADQKTRQSAADVVAAQTYQQQLGNELESNEADWRSFYNRLQNNQMNNYLTVQEVNRSNAFNPSISYDGQGYVINDIPTYSVDSSKIPMTQEPTKKKKSTKRFGK